MTNTVVQMRGVEKAYPHFKLQDIQLDLPQGHIMGFIGPNGAGKSTTIRILLGLIHQDRGTVQVLGHEMPREQVAAKWEVGFVSEDMRLYKQATLQWHMDFIKSIYPGWDAQYAQKLVKQFNLVPEQKLKGFSHGQRVKASLLLVLARRPKLLILDEPTTGLDPVARHEVIGEMMEVLADEARTILFSSHNTVDVEKISDLITFIDNGQVIESSDKESFLDRWKRLRLEIAPEVVLPLEKNIIDVQRSGRLAVVTTNHFNEELSVKFQRAGATINSIESLSLEEIFIANVQERRMGATA